MLTKMTDADWITVLRVFEIVRFGAVTRGRTAAPVSSKQSANSNFKRIAMRPEKTAQNYGSFVALACAFILIKSVHTA